MKKRQSAGEFSRTISGQWTKSEKREAAFRSIMESKKKVHRIQKAIRQQASMQ